ncbi:outer membrane protein assembly factor BamB [Thiomonas sp. FB-6]|uniref:outer membrane protein assembly factor BamB n=1 Tax=Thiomonas sp. FB-6 TaxID=1158291 RepID=UPI00036E334A|nr:outer membrane protein assembly factor BamB [Thiomonas sp. FB-6]
MKRGLWMARLARVVGAGVALGLLGLLGACSSAPKQPDPTPLGPVPPILRVDTVWHDSVGPVPSTFHAAVAGARVVVASSNGDVLCLSTSDGRELWHSHVDGGISAGVGSDGNFSAVVNAVNQVVSLGPQGQVLWRYQLPSSVITPPAVFGGIIVVQGADQHLWAFDAATGAKRWDDEFSAPALLLQRGSGMALADGDVVLGDARGRLHAVRLADGTALWDVQIGRPRGVTEVERLVSITGTPALAQGVACSRAYQSDLGCVDMTSGRLLWSARADGYSSVSQNGQELAAAQADGVVQAYAVADGKQLWHNDQLKYRKLGAPLLAGHTVAVGDLQGYVSFLDAKDGQIIGRASTDGSPIDSPMSLAGNTLVVVTSKGGIYGFLPR